MSLVSVISASLGNQAGVTPDSLSGTASGTNSLAVGTTSLASGNNSTAVGQNATASALGGVALGQGAMVNSNATNSVAIGTGSVATRPNTVEFGNRTLSGVANGVQATDAINKGQFDEGMKKSRRGIATALAVAGLPQVDSSKVAAVAVSIGSQGGETAFALGVSTRLHENIKLNIGGAVSGSQTGYNIGAAFQW
jgi:autotransporter adhesin